MELLPEEQWRGPSTKLPTAAAGEAAAGEGGEGDAADDGAADGAHIAQVRRIERSEVGGLERRSWRSIRLIAALYSLNVTSTQRACLPAFCPGRSCGALWRGCGSGRRRQQAAHRCGPDGGAGAWLCLSPCTCRLHCRECSLLRVAAAPAHVRLKQPACLPIDSSMLHPSCSLAAGKVVGIIKRNWRTRGYCGSLQVRISP